MPECPHVGPPAEQICRSDGMVSHAAAEDLDCTRPRLGKWAGTFPLRDGLATAGRDTQPGEVTHVPVRRAPRYLCELSFHTATPRRRRPPACRCRSGQFLRPLSFKPRVGVSALRGLRRLRRDSGNSHPRRQAPTGKGAAEGEAGWQGRTTPRAAPSAAPGAAPASCRRRSGPVPRSRKLANAAVRADGRRPHDGSR